MKTKTIILFTLLALITTNSLNAQGFVWAEGVGSSGDDIVMSQKTDNSGNHYFCGYFSGPSIQFGNVTLNNSNGNDFLPDLYLVKYDADWNVLWAFTPENDAQAYGDIYNPIDLDIDNSGNCYVTGSFRTSSITFGNITLNNTNPGGEYDPFIVKFNTTGAVLWAKSFGGMYRDKGRAIAVDPAGSSVFVAGWFYSDTITIGGIAYVNTDPSLNTSDIFLVKYDANGNYMWGVTNGSDNIDRYQAMDVDAQGNIIASGTFKGQQITFGNETLTNYNRFFDDLFMVKYNSDGSFAWVTQISGDKNENLTTLYIDQNSGLIYLGGFFNSSLAFLNGVPFVGNSYPEIGTYDGFIAKYSSNGSWYYFNTIGGQDNESITGITTDADRNVYVTGSFKSENAFFLLPGNKLDNSGLEGTSDVFVMKINRFFQFQWAKNAHGDVDDVGSSIILDGDDILLFGQSNADVSFNNISLTNQGGYDIFMARLSQEMNVFSGRVYYDANNNGHMDLDDIGVSNVVLQIGDDYYLSGNDGNYEIMLPAGNYNLVPQPDEFFNSNPESINFSFSSTGEVNSDNNIALQSNMDTAHLEVNILSLPSARKGQEFVSYLTFKNIGTVPLDSTTVSYPLNEDLIYLYSTPPEDYMTEDSAYWNVYDLQPFEERTIKIHQKVDTVLSGGSANLKDADDLIIICFGWWICRPVLIDVICYYVDDCYEVPDPNTGDPITQCDSVPVTDSITGDTTGYVTDSILHCDLYYWPFCGWWQWCLFINVPHDPNEIYVTPSDTLPYTPQQLEARDPLEYTIRFQNTGNDTCFNAVVLDTLDDNLDVSTFEMLGASHHYDVSIQGRVLKFTFNNILLPDSTTNEPESHAYINYRIKPKSDLQIGDSICNRADIYFDYEPPVLTNTVVTKIAEAYGIGENSYDILKNKVKIAPNPFSNSTTVYLPEDLSEESTFVIYDMTGRFVKEIPVGKTKTFTLDKNNLKTGMYIYMLKSNGKVIDNGKIIIK